MSEPEMTPEEAGRILADMQEGWDSAPCRLVVVGHNGDEYEKMAWDGQLPEADVRKVSEWAFEKYGPTITLVWDSGPSSSPEKSAHPITEEE